MPRHWTNSGKPGTTWHHKPMNSGAHGRGSDKKKVEQKWKRSRAGVPSSISARMVLSTMAMEDREEDEE
jgi:hypothetical protein